MRLTLYTDYSLRLLMFVAVKRDGLATIQEASEAFVISRNHLIKVAYHLGQKGFLQTQRGRNGGIRLARAPELISLGDVVRKMEDDWNMVECFKPSSNSCVITGPCRLRGVLAEALSAYFEVLDRFTLADLVARPSALARVLLAG
jgi:Rrf2 family transcriptional regulator, nitric oxide-sensitive transcriptional repressor